MQQLKKMIMSGSPAAQVLNRLYSNHAVLVIKAISFINMVSFGFITGQPMYYLVAISKAYKSVHGSVYRILQRMINQRLLAGICLAYYLMAVAITTSVWSNVSTLPCTIFISTALVALATDMVFSLTYNLSAIKFFYTKHPVAAPFDFRNGFLWMGQSATPHSLLLIRLVGVTAGAVKW